MPALRSDAARSRARILDVARTHDVHNLRLNDVARDAGLGIGTVYRHFPNAQALIEALADSTVQQLLETSRRAAAESDPAAAFDDYIRAGLELLLEFDGLQSVLMAPHDETSETHQAKLEIFGTFDGVLERAKAAGVVRPELTLDQITHLACGIEYAVRLGATADRSTFVDVLLAGLRPSA